MCGWGVGWWDGGWLVMVGRWEVGWCLAGARGGTEAVWWCGVSLPGRATSSQAGQSGQLQHYTPLYSTAQYTTPGQGCLDYILKLVNFTQPGLAAGLEGPGGTWRWSSQAYSGIV